MRSPARWRRPTKDKGRTTNTVKRLRPLSSVLPHERHYRRHHLGERADLLRGSGIPHAPARRTEPAAYIRTFACQLRSTLRMSFFARAGKKDISESYSTITLHS